MKRNTLQREADSHECTTLGATADNNEDFPRKPIDYAGRELLSTRLRLLSMLI
jgi:hypothetical protein